MGSEGDCSQGYRYVVGLVTVVRGLILTVYCGWAET